MFTRIIFQKMKKKNKAKDDEPDYSSLLVFGYGCKIFRDDEKAVEENLIPWMGTDLTIDRWVRPLQRREPFELDIFPVQV